MTPAWQGQVKMVRLVPMISAVMVKANSPQKLWSCWWERKPLAAQGENWSDRNLRALIPHTWWITVWGLSLSAKETFHFIIQVHILCQVWGSYSVGFHSIQQPSPKIQLLLELVEEGTTLIYHCPACRIHSFIGKLVLRTISDAKKNAAPLLCSFLPPFHPSFHRYVKSIYCVLGARVKMVN